MTGSRVTYTQLVQLTRAGCSEDGSQCSQGRDWHLRGCTVYPAAGSAYLCAARFFLGGLLKLYPLLAVNPINVHFACRASTP
jgi:hypothetical protein